MTTRQQLDAIQSASDFADRHARHTLTAELGNNSGAVDVAGMPGWVHILIRGDQNQAAIAFMATPIDHMDAAAGLLVEVEYVEPTGYVIRGLAATTTYPNNPWVGNVPNHAANHIRGDFGAGGKDPVDVYPRMIVPLRARATIPGTMTVWVEGGWYPMGGAEHYLTAQASPVITAPTLQRRCDFLYIGSDLALHWVTGTEVGSILITPSIPAFPTGEYYGIGWVYAVNGQTAIAETDIADARILGSSIGSAPGIHVLATTTGLGLQHTVSGLTARQVLIATGATDAEFRAIDPLDIPALDYLADPGADGIIIRTAENVTDVAEASDVAGLFSGSGDYLRSDGTKGTPKNAYYEPVTNGDPASPEIMFVNGDIVIVEV